MRGDLGGDPGHARTALRVLHATGWMPRLACQPCRPPYDPSARRSRPGPSGRAGARRSKRRRPRFAHRPRSLFLRVLRDLRVTNLLRATPPHANALQFCAPDHLAELVLGGPRGRCHARGRRHGWRANRGLEHLTCPPPIFPLDSIDQAGAASAASIVPSATQGPRTRHTSGVGEADDPAGESRRSPQRRSHPTRRSFVTLPTSTHSTTKMSPLASKQAACGAMN